MATYAKLASAFPTAVLLFFILFLPYKVLADSAELQAESSLHTQVQTEWHWRERAAIWLSLLVKCWENMWSVGITQNVLVGCINLTPIKVTLNISSNLPVWKNVFLLRPPAKFWQAFVLSKATSISAASGDDLQNPKESMLMHLRGLARFCVPCRLLWGLYTLHASVLMDVLWCYINIFLLFPLY